MIIVIIYYGHFKNEFSKKVSAFPNVLIFLTWMAKIPNPSATFNWSFVDEYGCFLTSSDFCQYLKCCFPLRKINKTKSIKFCSGITFLHGEFIFL